MALSDDKSDVLSGSQVLDSDELKELEDLSGPTASEPEKAEPDPPSVTPEAQLKKLDQEIKRHLDDLKAARIEANTAKGKLHAVKPGHKEELEQATTELATANQRVAQLAEAVRAAMEFRRKFLEQTPPVDTKLPRE